MHTENNNNLNKTFLIILQPLARLFLRFGRGYREYSELSKSAFVTVASEDYGVHGRPTNVSRIAAMTGLTRKDISRVRARIEAGKGAETDRTTPVKEVIAGWCSNDEFLDENGQPALLPLFGKRASFQSLVRQFAGDIPEGAMRKELQRIRAVEISGEMIRLNPPDEDAMRAEKEMANQLRAGPFPLLAALAHNESVYKDDDRWPLENVRHSAIRKTDVDRVRKLVSVRLRAATTNIADLLESYATLHNGEGRDAPMVTVSAGVFYTEGLDVNEQ